MEFVQKCIDITPEMAFCLIEVCVSVVVHRISHLQALRQHHIEYIVAPYEADAQLAYLSLNNLVHVCCCVLFI